MAGERFSSVFDIIGPIMVGPSSSHTAGAARIGKVVRHIFGEQPTKVTFYLYESFAKTYRGHGTDVALTAGILGMDPEDARLPQSKEIAKDLGIEVVFVPTKEQADHPNTVKVIIETPTRSLSVLGSSIGGGKIQVTEIDGFKIQLEEGQPTIMIVHQDVPGMVAAVSRILTNHGINISTMSVSRVFKGEKAIMMIEVDQFEIGDTIKELKTLDHLHQASFFK